MLLRVLARNNSLQKANSEGGGTYMELNHVKILEFLFVKSYDGMPCARACGSFAASCSRVFLGNLEKSIKIYENL